MNINNKQILVSLAIKKSVSDVFQAFINPEHTTKFWFSASTGKLVPGEKVTWKWDWYDVSVEVDVVEIIDNEKIYFKWTGGNKTTHVDFTFHTINTDLTFLVITQFGFSGTEDELIKTLLDANGGFTLVAAGAKAYLEHGIQINLIEDKFPSEVSAYFENLSTKDQ